MLSSQLIRLALVYGRAIVCYKPWFALCFAFVVRYFFSCSFVFICCLYTFCVVSLFLCGSVVYIFLLLVLVASLGILLYKTPIVSSITFMSFEVLNV